jgi:hypothetical protein
MRLKVSWRCANAGTWMCRPSTDSAASRAAGDLVAAGWQRLHAARVCDDQQDVEAAQALRLAALALLLGPSWTSPFGPAYGGSGNAHELPVCTVK